MLSTSALQVRENLRPRAGKRGVEIGTEDEFGAWQAPTAVIAA